MQALVSAVEQVVDLPAYRQTVLDDAPAIAQQANPTRGVFLGYDFHLSPEGVRLIEINTNAGGALLNTFLARAQTACCQDMAWASAANIKLANLEKTFFEMFSQEWQRQRGTQPLRQIAIIDDEPNNQYLCPEFQLFQQLFQSFGMQAVVIDARELTWRDGKLWANERPIDLVYNRLTDFYLEDDAHHALKMAYEANAVVLTPHPQAHALYANKHNLVRLSNVQFLAQLGINEAIQQTLLSIIPTTETVTPTKADDLWARRKQLFFKPANGYGSKATYRGDKMTRRVWEEILQGDYVAQQLVPPSARRLQADGVEAELKVDIRAYAYAGEIQLLAARLYTGQTTNFRTSGGGFAPVFLMPN
jgi:glutathione synthase/RimK-type ligase-like ATP-grasp enzyme